MQKEQDKSQVFFRVPKKVVHVLSFLFITFFKSKIHMYKLYAQDAHQRVLGKLFHSVLLAHSYTLCFIIQVFLFSHHFYRILGHGSNEYTFAFTHVFLSCGVVERNSRRKHQAALGLFTGT